MNNKDMLELLAFLAIWMILMILCAAVGEWLGLLLFGIGTVLMGMYAYFEDRLEQAQKQARKRIAPYSAKLNEAYKNKEVFK